MKKYVFSFILIPILLSAQEDDMIKEELDKIIITDFKVKLDAFNRNLYLIDEDMIESKGYTSLNQVFSYSPFTTFSNTGIGTNIDLRGQGNSTNVNTQVLLNGISLNMLDSAHGVTPISSIGVNEIESIEILPGGGAVMYGNGTRGGVINISTKRRYKQFAATIGSAYSYANGSNVKFYSKIGDKIDKNLYLSIGNNYLFSQGYRDGDTGYSNNINGNITWDMNASHSLSLDLGFFKDKKKSSPILRFGEIATPSKKYRNKAGNEKHSYPK